MEAFTQQRISKEYFIQNGRDFVLAAIDSYAQQATDCDNAKGWLVVKPN